MNNIIPAATIGPRTNQTAHGYGACYSSVAGALSFRTITPEDMSLIFTYLEREPGRTCDFSYGGILMWVDLFRYEFAIAHDTLFVKGRLENNLALPAYSMPVGGLSLRESVRLLEHNNAGTKDPLMFSAVPEYALSQFMSLSPHKITLLDGWCDYIYDAEKLATLSGRKMAKKRNHVNQYLNLYGSDTYEPLSKTNIKEVELYMSGLVTSDVSTAGMAYEERLLALKTLRMMQEYDLPYTGGLLRVNGRVAAFTIGDIKGDTLFVHIEKADRDIPGAYETINKCFAADMLSMYPHIKYINREDDAGDPGLRKAKESYHPIEVLKKYNVIF